MKNMIAVIPSVQDFLTLRPISPSGWYCPYTGQPLHAPPGKNWLSYLAPEAQRRVQKNNARINAWLNKYALVPDALPIAPCHRSRSILADTLVPAGANINLGERPFVVGLWARYTRLFNSAMRTLPEKQAGQLVRKLAHLENLYMANWQQTSHAIDVIREALDQRPRRPVSCLPMPAPAYVLLPAVCQTTLDRQALDAALRLGNIH